MLTAKDNFNINFSGLTHDHSPKSDNNDTSDDANTYSAIAILRRHPMYDCLVLVKKYRACLGGYSLEFPMDRLRDDQEGEQDDQHTDDGRSKKNGSASENNSTSKCGRRQLVSRYLDGDDPMHRACRTDNITSNTENMTGHEATCATGCLLSSFMPQIDDKGDICELVHVPINGLLDRLESYTRSQVAVDSRVYAFAMGLKTAERIMTTKAMKELEETPI